MTKTWRCKEATLVPGFGIVRPGATVDFDDGNEPVEVRINFECLTQTEIDAIDLKKIDDNDLTFRAKIEKLKDMKVKIPKGCNKVQIDELFDQFINNVELPDIVN